MKHTGIKICGFGGQGIILSGYIMGKAAAIYDKKHATLTQSYGPESRGGACSAQVIISDRKVDYPEVLHPDILIVMSKEAYDKYVPGLNNKGMLIYDEDLVENDNKFLTGTGIFSIPATRIAEDLGKKIVANIIMLGFFTAVTDIIKVKSMENALLSSIPEGTEKLNLKAFRLGYDYGLKKLNSKCDEGK
jgi:2-oxoglutarate ferredoxin oxidoreductase subunit gamma